MIGNCEICIKLAAFDEPSKKSTQKYLFDKGLWVHLDSLSNKFCPNKRFSHSLPIQWSRINGRNVIEVPANYPKSASCAGTI